MNIKQMAVAALAASAVFSAAAETELVGAKVSPDEPLNAWRTIPLPRAIISRR